VQAKSIRHYLFFIKSSIMKKNLLNAVESLGSLISTFCIFKSSLFRPAFFVSKKRCRLSLVLFFSLVAVWSQATTYYSKITGDANATATWGINPADGTGTAPGGFTTSGDIFILRAASNLTTTTSLWTVGNNVTLQIIGSLTTSGSVTVVGTLQLDGTIAINGGNNIVRIEGTVIFTNTSATQVSLAGAGAGNNFTLGAGATFKTVNVNGVSGANCSLPADAPLKNIQFSTGVNFEFNGAAVQATLGLPTTLDNLTINNANGVNLNNNTRVTETLILTNGIFNIGNNILTLDKGVTITAGNLNAASGTVIYNRNANGQAVLAINYKNLTFTNFNKILPSIGTIGISEIFTSGTATGHTITGSTINFNGTAQNVPAFTFHNFQTSGSGIKTMLGSITVNGNLSIGTGTTLNVSGNFAINAAGNWTNDGIFTPATGTVTLNGTVNQIIAGNGSTTFNNLTISNSNTNGVAIAQDVTINSTLTLSSGTFNVDGKVLTLGSSANAVAGSFSATRMIIASGGGEVRKAAINASQASYTFPVGDNTGTAEYTPVTLAFSGGSYNGYSSVKLVNAKHPNNANTTNFLNRYWTIRTSDYSNFNATVSTTYVDADITGTEANILMGKWNGILPWQRFPASINTTTNTLTATAVNSFSDFTGINSANPAVSITPVSAIVCVNGSMPLTANATGDAPITYLWNPGNVTTSAFSPSTAVAGTINYTVTATDGNGFTASANQDVVVKATPQGSLSSNGTICSGSTGQLTFTATSGTGPFTIVYNDEVANRTKNDVTSGVAFNVFSNPTTNTTYTLVSITDYNNCSRNTGFTNDGSAAITINEQTEISSQPASQTVCEGDDVTFSVSIAGTGLMYQWQKDGNDIPGETGNSITLTNITATDAGSYAVIVNSTCSPALVSNPAILTVNIAPAITLQPSSQTVCEGSDVTFSINATGTDLTYKWQKDGNDIINAISSSLTLNDVSTADAGSYTVTVNGACTPSVISNAATLLINTTPTVSAANISNVPNDGNNCNATIAFGIDVITAGSPAPTVVYKIGNTVITSPHVFPVGTTVVTVEAINICGTANTTFDVTVNDVTAPVIACPVGVTINCQDNIGPVNTGSATANDNCDLTTAIAYSDVNTQHADAANGSHYNYTITRSWKAIDAAGNFSTCNQLITVHDITQPVANNCPANITVYTGAGRSTCDQIVSWTAPIATDNCSSVSATSNHNPGDLFPVGTTTVTYNFKDVSENTSSCSFTVTVIDNTVPVITCPANITVYTGAGRTTCDQIVSWTAPIATDNCTSVSATSNHNPGDLFPVGTTTVTYNFKDASENTSSCSFTVTVIDNTVPVITCPANITVYTGAGRSTCDQIVSWTTPTATDNCSSVSATSNHNPGDLFHGGTTTVTYTFKDASENTSTCSFTVTVIDNTVPVITCPAGSPFIRNTNAGLCSYKVIGTVFDPFSFSDNCTGTTIKNNFNNSSSLGNAVLPKGTNNIIWTATDAADNTASCSIIIKVEDRENPVITCPENITLTGNQNTATWTEPTGDDNCPGWIVTRTGPAPGSTFADGITTITYTVTDASGNQNSCSFTVTKTGSSIENCTNNNPVLYYGYSGDQAATITATPATGVGPYTVKITMNRPLLCNQVNDAGDEIWTTGSNGGTTTNSTCPATLAPVSTKTISSGSYAVTVTLMADADITVTITDATGLITTCTKHIHADDVRCFAGNSGNAKVTICHQTGSSKNPCVKICVDEDAVSEHVAHGDFLGKCTSNCMAPSSTKAISNQAGVVNAGAGKLSVKAMPNPTSNYFTMVIDSKSREPYRLTVLDVAGRVIQQKSYSTGNGKIQLGHTYLPGIYIAEIRQGKERVIVRLIKEGN
jgi:hypothetical protein